MTDGVLKRYTVGEEIFNSISHGVGSVLAVCGMTVLIVLSVLNNTALGLATSIIYGISLIVLYTMSTVYHAVPQPKAKEILRVFDHASIFLLIEMCIRDRFCSDAMGRPVPVSPVCRR